MSRGSPCVLETRVPRSALGCSSLQTEQGVKSSYGICEVSEGWGEGAEVVVVHFRLMWRLLVTTEVHHFWLWNELLIICLQGARFKVSSCEEGRRRAPSMFWPNTTCFCMNAERWEVKGLFYPAKRLRYFSWKDGTGEEWQENWAVDLQHVTLHVKTLKLHLSFVVISYCSK